MKVIKDCLHGHIKVIPVCQAFMSTPEFQRLRFTRQLGLAHYLYPSAVHTRFEHSLGVMHLARKMMNALARTVQNSPYQEFFTQRRRELIQLGAMLHDLGHMAFSHLFDQFLMAASCDHDDIFSHHAHEERSVAMMKQINQRIRVLTNEEEEFVANVIMGAVPDNEPPFLYEIVNNRNCGVDVDKMDYLRRDAYHTGMTGFRSEFIILHSTVNSEGHLAFHNKARPDVANLFAARYSMHLQVYRHPTTRKFDKLYWCMLYRLGGALFKYGTATNDVLIEALIQTSEDEDIQSLLTQVHTRNLDHSCNHCAKYNIDAPITTSGSVEQVPFV